MTDREQFSTKVEPIMDRVMQDLRSRQAEEVRRFMRSPAYILSGISGPDGGMASQAIALDSLKVTGEWNSKTVEDYVEMVKAELRKEGITVTPQLEEMMIDKMAREQVPQSSIDYILRKAAGNSIFGLPEEARKTPNAVIDTVDAHQRKAVPKVIAPGHEQEWIDANTKKQEPAVSEALETKPVQEPATEGKEEGEEKGKEGQNTVDSQWKKEESALRKEVAPESTEPQQQAAPRRTNVGGWQGILTGLGLNGLGDIGRNAGYILAMLPDMLLGMFTGKTQSLGVRDNLVPIASIMAGLFVKNPLLKMTLIGLGGANLLNKAGHEQLAKQEGVQLQTVPQVRYLQYEDEQMDPRIRDAQVRGNALIATLDGIPVTIALPEKVIDAYNQGALPLGRLANAVLEKCDRLQQMSEAQERFEQESRTETRGITQR